MKQGELFKKGHMLEINTQFCYTLSWWCGSPTGGQQRSEVRKMSA